MQEKRMNNLISRQAEKLKVASDLMEEKFDECIQEMQSLRIDIENECQYRDSTGILRDKYERANEMLDDCIEIVRKYIYR